MKDLAKQWVTRLVRGAEADAELRRSLAESLYASPLSLVMGGVIAITLGSMIAFLSHDGVIKSTIVVLVLVAGIRMASLYAFHQKTGHISAPVKKLQQVAFATGSWIHAGLIGFLAFSTITRVDDPALHVVAVTLAIAYAGAISGRNAACFRAAIGQAALSVIPVSCGLWIEGGFAYRVLAFVLFLIILVFVGISARTHRIVVNAMRGEREKSQLAMKYERLARFDSLTGVENRMAMQLRLREIFEKNRRANDAVAVLWMDLDRFKEINDSIGHLVGDHLLCAVAEKLSEALDGRGHVARFGGDEFILICPGVNRAGAQEIAQDVLDYFRDSFDVAGHTLSVTASLGIAIAPQDGGSVDELMQHADMALYQAKGTGRNRAVSFTWSMKERLARLHDIETGLRRAVECQEFSLHFQPVFNLDTGTVVACEALLRWAHPSLGSVPPAEFIPIAENIGVIEEISDWVLAEACTAALEWPDDIRVAVNMSAALFRTVDLPRRVIGHLMAAGLPARRLELEVTENVFLDNQLRTSAMLLDLRKIGLRLALDDFGTGYSSLSYLSAYAFDTIKVDESFMHNVQSSPENQAVVRAVAFLAAELGMDTVAEGIETEDQQSYAANAGFTYGQGFLLCPPQPRAEMARLLAAGIDIAMQRNLRVSPLGRKRA